MCQTTGEIAVSARLSLAELGSVVDGYVADFKALCVKHDVAADQRVVLMQAGELAPTITDAQVSAAGFTLVHTPDELKAHVTSDTKIVFVSASEADDADWPWLAGLYQQGTTIGGITIAPDALGQKLGVADITGSRPFQSKPFAVFVAKSWVDSQRASGRPGPYKPPLVLLSKANEFASDVNLDLMMLNGS